MKFNFSAIYKNLIANFFGIGVQLFNQIILVPLYLYYWDVNIYSDWILITAISSFFAMSDIGLNSVTINQFVIEYTRNNVTICKSLLTNNYIIILLFFIVILVGSSLFISFFDINHALGLHVLSKKTASIVFLLLIIHIFLGLVSSVLDSIYRASSMNHKAVYIGNLVRLLEGIIIMFSLIFKIDLITMTLLYLLPRVISFIFKVLDTKKYFNYSFKLNDINWSLLKQMIYPSLTFMSFPLGNAIIFQGFSLVVNRFFGAQILVIYNTTRTLTSFLTQILGAILQAFWPEFSIAYGNKDYNRMKQLHRKSFFISSSTAIGISILLLIFGQFIFIIWTQGKIPFQFNLMFAFLIVLIVRNFWSASSVILMSTNKHSKLGIYYVIFAIISILLANLTNIYFRELTLNVYCLLILELFLTYYSLKEALKLSQDNIKEMIFSNQKHLIN